MSDGSAATTVSADARIEWGGQGNMTSRLRRPRDPFPNAWVCSECKVENLPAYMLSCPTLGCRGKRPK